MMSEFDCIAAAVKVVFFDDKFFISCVCGWKWRGAVDVIDEIFWESAFENANEILIVGIVSCSRSKDVEALKEFGSRFSFPVHKCLEIVKRVARFVRVGKCGCQVVSESRPISPCYIRYNPCCGISLCLCLLNPVLCP